MTKALVNRGIGDDIVQFLYLGGFEGQLSGHTRVSRGRVYFLYLGCFESLYFVVFGVFCKFVFFVFGVVCNCLFFLY